MVESFYKKERMTTVQYPEERAPISPNFRNFPFLVHDGDPIAGLRCVACSICEKECPPQCIYIVLERDENGKSLKRPKVFDIDVSVCMNCGICAEVCPFDSIYMDGEYELSTDDRFGGLLFDLRPPREIRGIPHETPARTGIRSDGPPQGRGGEKSRRRRREGGQGKGRQGSEGKGRRRGEGRH